MRLPLPSLLLFLAIATSSSAREIPQFTTVVLGSAGGLTEDNLSAYLVAPAGDTRYACLDAGTLLAGLQQAIEMGSFHDIRQPADSPFLLEGWILQNHIKAYLISHAHLDHIAGLVLNSPDDTPKDILGLDSTLDLLQEHLFNGKIWPNFTNGGSKPTLDKYRCIRLKPRKSRLIPGTAMSVEAFPLSHGPECTSTAFLIEAAGYSILYCGDTGPDAVERSTHLKKLWTAIAPLIRDHKLRAIFLEISYPDGRPDKLLFGHFTPSWMMFELRKLAALVRPEDPQSALKDLTVVVTHAKPSLKKGPTPQSQIMEQLRPMNDLGIRLVPAQQGERLDF